MKKKEYVFPEMEIVEITEQGSLLAGVSGGDLGDTEKGGDDDLPPGWGV